MTKQVFDLDAGALCLDFANTVEWHASDHPEDRLAGYADLAAWGEAAGLVDAERAAVLRRLAAEQPGRARAVFERALATREAIYRLFANYAEQAPAAAEDLALLNRALGEAFSHLRITAGGGGFSWAWAGDEDDLVQILWPVVHSAAELLSSDQLERVSQCADDRGCGYLFLDTSRNRSRRWCSMASCGNRAKAKRHFAKQKEAH